MYNLAVTLVIGIKDKARKLKLLFFQLYYKALFSIRKSTLKKFDNLVTEREAYFTVELKGAGFTDQLSKFVVFYSFGKLLNFKYYYTPLFSIRSTAEMISGQKVKTDGQYENIYDFLGVPDYLKSISVDVTDFDSDPFILKIKESYFLGRGLTNKELIASYLKLKLYPVIRNQDTIHIKIMPEGVSSYFGLHNKLNGCTDSGLDFRSALERKQEQNSEDKPERDHFRIRMMVHIRQGDTAIVKTPWNTFINVWGRFKNSMKEFDSLEKARTFIHIEIEEYYNLLTSLSQHLDPEFFPIRIFSDGYKRAFKVLVLNKERLELTKPQIDQLNEYEKSYDQKAFRMFDTNNQYQLVVGEDDQKLYSFIDTLLHTDVVIVGTQQRMVAKFLAVYCNSKNMPLVIILYNQVMPNHLGLARHEPLSNFLLININDYDASIIARRIKEFLKARNEEKQPVL